MKYQNICGCVFNFLHTHMHAHKQTKAKQPCPSISGVIKTSTGVYPEVARESYLKINKLHTTNDNTILTYSKFIKNTI